MLTRSPRLQLGIVKLHPGVARRPAQVTVVLDRLAAGDDAASVPLGLLQVSERDHSAAHGVGKQVDELVESVLEGAYNGSSIHVKR